MKLTKEDLKRLVWHSQAGLTDCDSLAWLEFIDGILNGRYDEPLEIEGYERVQWTRFDPNDPKTFPNEYPVMVLLTYGGIDLCAYFYEGKFQTGVVDSYAPEKITHWRPLPKPPVETETKHD